MQITKEFRIHEVRATRASNVPFQIILESSSFRKEESSLTLDANTCARYNIPMSLDLVGRTIICSFESRELPLQKDEYWRGHVDMGSVGKDDLVIKSLERNELVLEVSFGTALPPKHSEVSRTMNLSSFGEGDGMHPHVMPCPFYRFFLELTEEEYEGCKALSSLSVFKVSLQLKD